MTNRASFKHKQGLQGRKLQGCQIDEGEGAILQLCSRAPKLMNTPLEYMVLQSQ